VTPGGAPLVTFHLFRVPRSGIAGALLRMALDRAPLRATPGLRFFKLVGTGSGRTFTVRDADPTRWGLVAAWDSAAAVERFEQTSPVPRAWASLADERWRVDLVPLRSKGTWAGRDPFGPAGHDPTGSGAGPVAALTRARIRWSLARRFWRSVPPVSADLHDQPGLRFTIGFGEAPVGLQGTFSLWTSAADLQAFAYSGAPHRDAIAATHRLQWYAEELFTRFAVVGSTGTVDGRDPLEQRTGDRRP
jgi:hypothetical protein